ncbi:VOC family protein [Paenibacillus sepulcri]|uniref:VOC family protein n=1 Tax=Paenibacillus sepulcri TaxID=359917 RepID=A0ABS7C5H2_9BACL|nr:VOC family protein [Paenibacillus sepulcri]
MTMALMPYLMMDGNAEEAIQYYAQTLNAKVLFKQTVGEGPDNPDSPYSEDEKKRIAHSVLKVGETDFYVADLLPGLLPGGGNQITICLTTEDKDQAKQVYGSLQQEGHVIMPLQEIYFSPAYGMVTDKFGITFQIFTKRQQ